MMLTVPPKTLPAQSPRFRSFVADGAGGWRQVTGRAEMRGLAVRAMLAGYGLLPAPAKAPADDTPAAIFPAAGKGGE